MHQLGNNPDCSARLAEKAREYPEFWNIGFARVNGDIICHALPFPRPLNIADREYFKEVLKQSDMVISGPVVARVIDIPTIILSRALRGEGGTSKGCITWPSVSNGCKVPLPRRSSPKDHDRDS